MFAEFNRTKVTLIHRYIPTYINKACKKDEIFSLKKDIK